MIKGTAIVKKVYNKEGVLLTMQSFTKDTIPNGALIHFYPNGKIKQWTWYSSELKNPFATVLYKNNGMFDTLHGNPFIKSVTSGNDVYVELINPPNVNVIFGFKDFYRDSLMKKVVYQPDLTDSTGWVILRSKDVNFKKDHNYMCNFLIADTFKKEYIYVSAPFKLVP